MVPSTTTSSSLRTCRQVVERRHCHGRRPGRGELPLRLARERNDAAPAAAARARRSLIEVVGEAVSRRVIGLRRGRRCDRRRLPYRSMVQGQSSPVTVCGREHRVPLLQLCSSRRPVIEVTHAALLKPHKAYGYSNSPTLKTRAHQTSSSTTSPGPVWKTCASRSKAVVGGSDWPGLTGLGCTDQWR